jgi:hydroxymethylbilane synthase
VTIETVDEKRPGLDKARFVKEIDEALLRGEIDLAVHSAKDVPGLLPEGLVIVGAPPAEDARDAVVGDVRSLEDLPDGARVGTSSLRRRSQLLAIRPDLELASLRGNVDTRLAKLERGDYDAIVLAMAGLRRLGSNAGAPVEADEIVPAPGQGILALEAREGDDRAASVATSITERAAVSRLEAERAVVTALDTSCRTPVGAHARFAGGRLRIDAYVGLPDGSDWIRDQLDGDASDPTATGNALARRMLTAGAGEMLRRAEAASA